MTPEVSHIQVTNGKPTVTKKMDMTTFMSCFFTKYNCIVNTQISFMEQN